MCRNGGMSYALESPMSVNKYGVDSLSLKIKCTEIASYRIIGETFKQSLEWNEVRKTSKHVERRLYLRNVIFVTQVQVVVDLDLDQLI